MNDTLSFHEHLLARATHLIKLGQLGEGREFLHIVLAGEDTPAAARAKARCLLGELEFDAGHYRIARRHYAAAMSLRPYDAEACLAYARAVDADPDADPKKGYAACRRATRIDEFEPRHWAALGQAAIRAGMPLKAIKAFRRSAHLRPDCPNLLLDLANGFLTLGQVTEARGVLSAARFRSPKNAQIHRVWERFQFELARRRQERQRSEGSESPVLTFPGRQSEPTAPASPVIIRADHHSRIKPHVFRMFGSRRDPRRAK